MTRIMGIDYGVHRIGVALSDLLGCTAQPFEVVERVSIKKDIERLREIARSKEVELVVMGLPLNMDGTPGMLTDEVNGFAARIGEALKVPVELYDERLTTLQAERMLIEEGDVSREKRKQVRDKVAAALILQAYLDSKRV